MTEETSPVLTAEEEHKNTNSRKILNEAMKIFFPTLIVSLNHIKCAQSDGR